MYMVRSMFPLVLKHMLIGIKSSGIIYPTSKHDLPDFRQGGYKLGLVWFYEVMTMKLSIWTNFFYSIVFALGLPAAGAAASANSIKSSELLAEGGSGAGMTSHVTTTTSQTVPASPVSTVTTTTTSTTSTNSTSAAPTLRSQPIEETVRRSIELKDADLQPERIRKDEKLANRLARSHWLEKAVAEDPEIIAAITQYSGSAKILAKHPRLGHIAEYDHYLCRQLTKWKGASRALANNPQAQAVLYYDPEGIYRAIKVDRGTARRLSRNTEFAQMVIDNPDLARVLASYM